VIDTTLEAHASVGAPPTWVLSNHDVVRHVTRYGRAETGFPRHDAKRLYASPVDVELGTRRASAASSAAWAALRVAFTRSSSPP
jgi:alpha-glucosidase